MSHNKRLKELRLRHRLSQKELATRLGVAQSLISQVEREERALSANLIMKAVSAFDLDADFFERPPSPYNRLSLNFRTKVLSAGAKDSIILEFSELERETRKLLANIPVTELPVCEEKRSAMMPAEEIEKFAQATRDTLQLGRDTPVPNVVRAIERAGVGVVEFPTDLDLEGKVDGVSTPSINPPYVIVITPEGPGERQRFTTAHELGHLVLHRAQRPESESVRESEAHAFAGAFLLPETAIRPHLSPTLTLFGYAALKNTWGVSIQAIIRRAVTLGVISQERYKSLMIQLSSRGWRVDEPYPIEREKPVLVPKLRDAQLNNVVSLFNHRRDTPAGKR